MILTLRLQAADGSSAATRTLEHGTLTIGRGAENGWVLADEDRTISKQHCRIDRSEQGFLLTDTSTNGVYLNTAVQPLGRGHSHVLAPDDVVVVGPFHLVVGLEQPPAVLPEAVELPRPKLPDPAPAAYTGTVHTAGSPIIPPEDTPWLHAIPGGKFGPDLRPAPQGWEAPPEPGAYAASGERPPDGPLEVDAASAFTGESEHADALATAIRLPATQTVLPSDWNDLDPLDGAGLTSLPVDAALARAAAPAEPQLPLHEPQGAWRDAPAAPVAAPSEGGPDAYRLLSAFLSGAGLPPDVLAGASPEAAFRALGELLRVSVEGVRDILATRAMVKSELRADQTVIQAADNNPLKFAPDVQRCLAAMVGEPLAGFLPGAEAMRRSMDDIKRHELALIGALNSVLAEMTVQLEPEAIASQARTEAGLATVLPVTRDARCWALYQKRFAAVQGSGDAVNTAGSLLAPVAAAYAKALRGR